MSKQDRFSEVARVAVATGVTVACVLPVFLAGGLAVQIRSEFDFGPAVLGVCLAAFVGAQALLSRTFGAAADRMGAGRALMIASLGSASSSVAVAVAVHGPVGLGVALAMAGAANALGQPAASRLLARSISHGRQGVAFGVFQSSKPLAGLLAGLAVPTVALTVGWRWAFVAAALGAVALASLIPRDFRPSVGASRPMPLAPVLPRGVLALLLTGIALGFGAVKVFSAFIVDAGVMAGFRPGTAGMLLAVGSGLAVVARLGVGVLVDRRGVEELRLVAVMLASGAAGFFLLALGRPLAMLVGVAGVALGAWGYNGVFYLAMTRLLRESPGAITGVMLSGASVGGVVAPVVFGLVVSRFSYALAWGLVGGWTLLGAVAMRVASARVLESGMADIPA